MINIQANELLSAMSLALDVAENQPFEHAQRTAYIALLIAKELNLSQEEVSDIYTAALLHDIGVTTSKTDLYKDEALLTAHCNVGANIVQELPFSRNAVDYIRWHHANWDGSGPFELSGKEIPLGAQILYISDRTELKLKEVGTLYSDRSLVENFLKESRGHLFSPDITDALLAIQSREKFWLDYFSPYLADFLSSIKPTVNISSDANLLEKISQTFATIIDNKSPFTFNHSKGLTELAVTLGKHYKFPEEMLKQIEISALLHDLGKLAVPNEILDKPGKLTPEEFRVIKSHTYYTKLILSKISGLEQIKEWAGNHHETLDGLGYPEGISDLDLPSQIIAVCDIYQALTEVRPYRTPMPQSKVFEIISDITNKGKLSKEVFINLQKALA